MPQDRLLSDDDIKLLMESGDLDQHAMQMLEQRSPQDALAATMLGAEGSPVMGGMPMPPFGGIPSGAAAKGPGVASKIGNVASNLGPVVDSAKAAWNKGGATAVGAGTALSGHPFIGGALSRMLSKFKFEMPPETPTNLINEGRGTFQDSLNRVGKGVQLRGSGGGGGMADPPNLLRTAEGAEERVRGGVQNNFRGTAHIDPTAKPGIPKPVARRASPFAAQPHPEIPTGFKASNANPAADSRNYINRSNADANANGDMGEVERIMAELAALLSKRK